MCVFYFSVWVLESRHCSATYQNHSSVKYCPYLCVSLLILCTCTVCVHYVSCSLIHMYMYSSFTSPMPVHFSYFLMSCFTCDSLYFVWVSPTFIYFLITFNSIIVAYFKDDIKCHFAASMTSGLFTTIASMPVDISKTRCCALYTFLVALMNPCGMVQCCCYNVESHSPHCACYTLIFCVLGSFLHPWPVLSFCVTKSL